MLIRFLLHLWGLLGKNMPQIPQAFSLNYSGFSNRIITDIDVFEYFSPDTFDPSNPPKSCKTQALWDTGATNSIITHETALALALTPIGKTKTNHAGGQSDHSTHLVNIILPNQVMVASVLVTEMEHIVDNFGVIIGMDIISKGDFSITNCEGKTCFSFRTPSIRKVDFVDDINKIMKNLRGHDKCPCLSGKQFRKCHGLNK
jgi:SEC-C motif